MVVFRLTSASDNSVGTEARTFPITQFEAMSTPTIKARAMLAAMARMWLRFSVVF